MIESKKLAGMIMMRLSWGLLSNQEFFNFCYSELLRLISVPLLYLSKSLWFLTINKVCEKSKTEVEDSCCVP